MYYNYYTILLSYPPPQLHYIIIDSFSIPNSNGLFFPPPSFDHSQHTSHNKLIYITYVEERQRWYLRGGAGKSSPPLSLPRDLLLGEGRGNTYLFKRL